MKRYVRVDGILGVPAVALEHSHSSSTVHIREVHKLSDRSLLLLCICWRHIVLVFVYARWRCRCLVAVAVRSCVNVGVREQGEETERREISGQSVVEKIGQNEAEAMLSFGEVRVVGKVTALRGRSRPHQVVPLLAPQEQG